MRVISGTSRGRRLAGPRGLNVRPTADPVKEALFNILANHIPNSRFLDLFAGTGNVGIEALSRGARHVTFVESNQSVATLLRANLQRCWFREEGLQRDSSAHHVDVVVRPVARFLARRPAPAYDLVFLDPPYQTQEAERVLPLLGRDAIIRENGLVVVEHFHKSHRDDRIGHLALVKTYRYGDSCLSVYQSVRQPEQEEPPL